MSKTKTKALNPRDEAKTINTAKDMQKHLICIESGDINMNDAMIKDLCDEKLNVNDIYGKLHKLNIIGVKGRTSGGALFQKSGGVELTLEVGKTYKFNGISSSYGPNLSLSKRGDYEDTMPSSPPKWVSEKMINLLSKRKSPSPLKINEKMKLIGIYYKNIGYRDTTTMRTVTKTMCNKINLGVFIYFKDPKISDKLLEFKYELQTDGNGLYPYFSNNTTTTFKDFVKQFTLPDDSILGGAKSNNNKTQRSPNKTQRKIQIKDK